MKRPKSPACTDSSPYPKVEEEEEDGEERRVAGGRRFKRERRHSGGSSSATLCQVCSIQLNSSAQARIHYQGKTHQRRLRRLAKAVSSGALSQSPVHPLLGSLTLPGRPLQPQAQLEHLLPLRVNGSSPLSLFPSFSAMDPVQKAVIKHTFGVAPPRKKPIISCNICHLRFNSTNQAEAHYKGHKHARKMKALETQRIRQRNRSGSSIPEKDRDQTRGGAAEADCPLKTITESRTSPQPAPTERLLRCSSSQRPSTDSSHLPHQLPPQTGPAPQRGSTGGEDEEEGPKVEEEGPKVEKEGSKVEEEGPKMEEVNKNLHCPACKVTVNSSSQLESHCSGSKHKQVIHGHSSSQSQSKVKVISSLRPTCQRMNSRTRAVVGVSSQPFHCEMCRVSVNSETQLKQHMNSRRHRERLAGRPVKVKVMPYRKLQPSAILATKLALQKQLSKALPAGFLAGPLSPAALCTMASGPMALRLPTGPIFQGPMISPALFRPPPGPLRAPHAPIIFSPF
ncbi:zinc finger protein 385C-like isoform X2 [Antennarius striatus]|uniref:zinc finger protein 385C-like isoform X2 n=1 Tax=Antennarius striatus TaxID=241820 RepID=UPI0035B04D0B